MQDKNVNVANPPPPAEGGASWGIPDFSLDPRRLIPLLCLLFFLAVLIALLSGIMWRIDHKFPNWLPARMQGTGFDTDISQRVAAAETKFPADAKTGKYLCAFLGLSSIREASDLAGITEASGGRCRILGLCAAGPTLQDIDHYGTYLLDSNLRPDLVIIGVNEFNEAKPTAEQINAMARQRVTLMSAIRRHDVRNAAKLVLNDIWFYYRRQDVSLEFESLLENANAHIVNALGGHQANGATNPWREMIRLETPTKASLATFMEQINDYAARDLFKPQTYTSDMAAQQRGYLVDLIKSLQARGARVVVVLMPEDSLLRDRLPPDSVSELVSSLKSIRPNPPPVVNLRTAIGDPDFTDISHVNNDGRAAVSGMLAKIINQYLPQKQPPLMSKG
ncbi:MAG TPA: hypothetical protein VMD30_08895 [Tepidisphaeraceae bacterium]|nr:hypothetical protein [Tepidisphaeraceae bacterium]